MAQQPTVLFAPKRFRKADAMFMKSRIAVLCLASSGLVAPGVAQLVYPVQQQLPEQQRQDESRCVSWAIQQSGFDPARPWFSPQPSAPAATAGNSTGIRGGVAATIARGTTHPDAGDAAIAGAIVVASAQPIGGAVSGGTTRRSISAAGSGADGAMPAQALASEANARHAPTNAAAPNAEGTAITSSAGTAAAAAIVGRDAGSAVAGGAVAGATVRRDTSQMIVLPQEQAAARQPLVGQALFEKARNECLEARGYAIQ